jgi:DUF4097 and DUF4098 domain-containing protein YvlB
MQHLRFAALVIAMLAAAIPAAAQRFPFDRVIDVTPGATLDITTVRGKVFIDGDDATQIRIEGTVTVRPSAGFRTTGNPLDIARRVADKPRIEVAGNVVRLRPPSAPEEQVAVTVSYEIRVPRDTTVIVSSDSGAVEVNTVTGAVTVSTDSSEITLTGLGGNTQVKTGSGEVKVAGSSGGLRVATESSAMTLRGLAGALEARTQSGAIRASFTGAGSADVETGSSAIQLDGLSGRLAVRTQSGRVEVRGTPTAVWDVTTGSSLIEASFPPSAKFTLEATSSSSSVQLKGVTVDGVKEKGRASGAVGGGGPNVRLASRSGQIHIGH